MNAHKVLLIDDEPHIVRVLKMKLENAGHEVITATNGLDGLEKFVKERPSIMITDINMPIVDGQEMCNMIKERKEQFPCFVIVMTSSVESDVHSWAKGDDSIHFIEKPFSPRNILQLVEKYISSNQEARAEVGFQTGLPSGTDSEAAGTGY